MTAYLITYGTLKQGHERHELLDGHTEYIADVFLPGKLLNYKDMFPVWAMDGPDAVSAELYEITGDQEELFETLDEVEGHPFLFRRTTVEVQVPLNDDPFEEEEFDWKIAHVYVGAAPSLLDSPRIPSGHWPLDKGLLS